MSVDFKNVFSLSFSGRANRSEYATANVGLYVLSVGFGTLIASTMGEESGLWALLALYLVIMAFSISASVRRAHDVGNSGWYTLIPFYSFILLFLPGEVHRNRYNKN
jgi:uncharacterized membrane protein YhaH (DUF805 family)